MPEFLEETKPGIIITTDIVVTNITLSIGTWIEDDSSSYYR